MKVEFENKNRVDISMYQYDYGQQLEITGVDLPDEFELHVSVGTGRAEVVKGHFANGTGTVLLPDIALRQSVTSFDCWLFDKKECQGTTLRTIRIHLNRREYPSDVPCIDDLPKVKEYADYVKENAELVSYAKTVGDELKKLAENGAFNGKDGAAGPQGPKGEKGEPGTTDYNSLEHQPIVELEVEEGTNIADFHIGLWKMKSDVMITDSENSQVYLCAGDIVKIYGVVADDIEFTSAYSILSADWSAVGNIDDPIAQSLIINKNDLLTLTDDTLNDKSDFPVSNKAVTTELNSLKTKIERPSQFYFSPKTNTEYRFGTIYSPVAELEMDNGFAFGSDFISGLVFVSGETPTEFTYSKNIKFTGDDCNDNVFVPTAEKIYDIVFWSNDCGLQAVVRGVDR